MGDQCPHCNDVPELMDECIYCGCPYCGGDGGDGSTPMPHDFEEAEDYRYERMSEPPCPQCGRYYGRS